MRARLTQVAAAVRFMLGDWTPNAQTVSYRLRTWKPLESTNEYWVGADEHGNPIVGDPFEAWRPWIDDAWNRQTDPERKRTHQRGQSDLVDAFGEFKRRELVNGPT